MRGPSREHGRSMTACMTASGRAPSKRHHNQISCYVVCCLLWLCAFQKRSAHGNTDLTQPSRPTWKAHARPGTFYRFTGKVFKVHRHFHFAERGFPHGFVLTFTVSREIGRCARAITDVLQRARADGTQCHGRLYAKLCPPEGRRIHSCCAANRCYCESESRYFYKAGNRHHRRTFYATQRAWQW